MAHAFIIRPFGIKTDSAQKELDFDLVQRELIDPAIEASQLRGGTTGKIIDSGNIREDMFALILEADIVICDITILNPNVFYELGIRHALRRRATILIKGGPTADQTPFDIQTDRYLYYEIDNPGQFKERLIETIQATLKSDRETDSPVFRLLPKLPEVDLTNIQLVPLDFREEVERARAARSKGWLRLLSQEVQICRFTRAGLPLVAQHQWAIKDYEGARSSYASICKMYPNDVNANLAMATIYERLYSQSLDRLDYLEASDQAIERVLSNSPDRAKRVEAFSLKGRNEKTRWRQHFRQTDDEYENEEARLKKRRAQALHPSLWKAYQAYRAAFTQDLNHFYSGLAALQTGTILQDISQGNEEWQYLFDNEREAWYQKEKLAEDLKLLYANVQLAIDVKLAEPQISDDDYDWAKLSKADLFFLTEDEKSRAIRNYEYVISAEKSFMWDAAKKQLALFAELGIKAELASQIIAKFDALFKQLSNDEPKHIVIFAGHRIDTENSPKARFPSSQEVKARDLIKSELEDIHKMDKVTIALASGAPGGDILFHEVCDELSIESQLCLPIPSDSFSKSYLLNLPNEWKSRYLNLVSKHEQTHTVLQLSDIDDLPRWLSGAGIDRWERGNNWVLQIALAELTNSKDRVTLLVLWDGLPQDPKSKGGTAHMYEIAEQARVYLRPIDCNLLSKTS